MAKKQKNDDGRLSRREKVVADNDLPHVPAGTKGKVQLVNGLSWIRYWVRFENGEQIGQLKKGAKVFGSGRQGGLTLVSIEGTANTIILTGGTSFALSTADYEENCVR